MPLAGAEVSVDGAGFPTLRQRDMVFTVSQELAHARDLAFRLRFLAADSVADDLPYDANLRVEEMSVPDDFVIHGLVGVVVLWNVIALVMLRSSPFAFAWQAGIGIGAIGLAAKFSRARIQTDEDALVVFDVFGRERKRLWLASIQGAVDRSNGFYLQFDREEMYVAVEQKARKAFVDRLNQLAEGRYRRGVVPHDTREPLGVAEQQGQISG